MADTDRTPLTLVSVHVHPVKSCAALAVDAAVLIETGLEIDRHWMLVDEQGHFVTQRELPRLALVQPTLRRSDMVLRAPGMLALHIALDTVEAPTRVHLWDDELAAYDMGDLAAQWFSDFAGVRLRLARFDPQQKRLSSRRWCGDIEAENAFSDGFALLVVSTASLAGLNQRLAARSQAPLGMTRFRPNLVFDGLDAHGEDFLDEISIAAEGGTVRIKLVKPCTRCTIPDVDPATGERGDEPGATLALYRADARVGGAISFGMNAVILEGVDCVLRPGQAAEATLRF